MKTSARALTRSGPLTPGINSMNLIKSRINCNAGFAWNLMDKYHLSDSEFPPAYFVYLENGQEDKNQDEKGRILSLLLQLLHYENNSQNIMFQNMIFNNIKAEAEFRLEQMKLTSEKDYKEFFKLFENTVRLVNTEIQESRIMGLPKVGLGIEKKETERQYEHKSELYRKVEHDMRETRISEQNVNVTAVEKQLYKIEEDNRDFPVLTLKENQTTGLESVSAENKRMRDATENRKEYQTEPHNRTEGPTYMGERRDVVMPGHREIAYGDFGERLWEEERREHPEGASENQSESSPELHRQDYSEILHQRYLDTLHEIKKQEQRNELREEVREVIQQEAGANSRELFRENALEFLHETTRQNLHEEIRENTYTSLREEMSREHREEVRQKYEEFLHELETQNRREEVHERDFLHDTEHGQSREEIQQKYEEIFHELAVQNHFEEVHETERKLLHETEKLHEQVEAYGLESSPVTRWQEPQAEIRTGQLSVLPEEGKRQHREPALSKDGEFFWGERQSVGEGTRWESGEPLHVEAGESEVTQLPHNGSAQEKKRLERQLQKLRRKIYEADYLPSAKAQKVLQYLETITEDQQSYMAFVLGIERNELFEQLRHMDNRGWEILETKLISRLETFSTAETEEVGGDLTQTEVFDETTEAAGLLHWKYRLEEWVSFLEPEIWNELAGIVSEQDDSVPSPMRELFKHKDKAAVIGFFEEVSSIEELFPLIRLIHREPEFREDAAGWLPGMDRLIERQELIRQAEENRFAADPDQKKQLIRHWADLLEEAEWQNIVVKSFDSYQTKEEERETYIRWLTEIPPERSERILTPAAEILYRKQGMETAQREARDGEWNQNLPERLKEDIQTNELRNKIRALEIENWEQVKSVISSAVRRDVFLESLDSEQDLDIAVSILQREHRRFYRENTKSAAFAKTLYDRDAKEKQFPEHLQASGLLRWKHSLEEWIGFLEMGTWDLLTEVVTENGTVALSEMKNFFRTKDKGAVLAYVEQVESIEELFPLLQLINREERLQKEAAGWLPDIEQLTKRRELMGQAESLYTIKDLRQKKQLAWRWIQLLEEEEWPYGDEETLLHGENLRHEKPLLHWETLLHPETGETEREEYIGWLEHLPPEQKEQLLTPAAEILYRKPEMTVADQILKLQEEIGTDVIQTRLRELDRHHWRQLLKLTANEIHREVFLERLEQLSTEEKMQVLAPAVELLYQRTEQTQQSLREIFLEDIEKREIQKKIRGLELQSWEKVEKLTSFAVTKELFLKHMEQLNSETEVESVIHRLQRTHRIFYRNEKQREEKRLKEKQLVLRWTQLLEEEEGPYQEHETLLHRKSEAIDREVYIKWLEQLPQEQRERLLIPAAEILYRKQETESGENQEETLTQADRILKLMEEIHGNRIQTRLRSLESRHWQQIINLTSEVIQRESFLSRLEQLSTEEKMQILAPMAELLYRKTGQTERSFQGLLRDDIEKNEIQNRIRNLEFQGWEAVKKLTSFTLTKEQFLKHREQMNSEEKTEAQMHIMQRTNRLVYRKENRKEEQSLTKSEQQEVRKLYRQAVHQWRNVISTGSLSLSEQLSLTKHDTGRTVQTSSVWESPELLYETAISSVGPKSWGTRALPLLTGRKKGGTLSEGVRAWSPNRTPEEENPKTDFFYESAQMVTSRLPGRQTREMQVMPTVDVEKIVSQVKSETVNDIQMIKRHRTEQEFENQNTSQLTSLLKQLSSQQKEMEQMKQVQARLIQSTDMGKITETVMKQFKMQLRTEKLRRGL